MGKRKWGRFSSSQALKDSHRPTLVSRVRLDAYGFALCPYVLFLSGMPSGDAQLFLRWGCPLGTPVRALA